MSFRPLVLSLIFGSALNVSGAIPVLAEDVRNSMPTIAQVSTEPPSAPNGTGAVFTVRKYADHLDDQFNDDWDLMHPRRRVDEIVGIDVTNYLEICPDGTAQVRAIALGSWQFDLDGECVGDEMAADISVIWERLLIDSSASPPLDPR